MINTLTNIKSTFSPERQALTEEYIVILAAALNTLHTTTYSNRFWSFLLRKYVGSVISNLELYDNPEIKLWITNDAVSGFGRPTFKTLLKRDIINWMKKFKASTSDKDVFDLIQNNDSLHIGFPALKELNEDLGIKLPIINPIYNFRKNKKLRSRLRLISQKHDSILIQNMINGLPKIFVEGFKSTMDSIPLYNPKSKTFHYHIASGFYEWILAKYTENGSFLYWYQHGAYYGEMEYGAQVRERKLADVYRTWGWKIEEKDEPWKAYRLIKFKENFELYKKIERQSGILVPLSGSQPHAIKWKNAPVLDAIANNLDLKKYKLLIARPRPNSKLFTRKSSFKNVVPNSFLLTSGLKSIQEEMCQVSLIITPVVPATIFLECIFIDFPILGILSNDQPTEIIKPFYDFFLEQKVLHYTMDSMIEHLNSVTLDVWWAELTETPTYKEFKTTFANNF